MKRLFYIGLVIPFLVSSQQLSMETFENYELGFVTPDDQSTPGTSGYRLQTFEGPASNTTNLGVQMARFVEFNNSKALQLSSPNGVQSAAYLWKDGLNTQWEGRDAGNDIIKVNFDLTVPSTQSKTLMGMEIYDSTVDKVLAGILINTDDLGIYGITNWQPENNDIDNFAFDLIYQNQRELYTPGQTQNYEFAFNKNTGVVSIRVNGHSYDFQSLVAGLDPYELDFTTKVYIDSDNEVSFDGVFDNIYVEALSSLSTQNLDKLTSRSSFYSNPVGEKCEIKLSENFKAANTKVTILDMKGVKIFEAPFSNRMNVSYLKPGVYVLNLSDGQNTETLKMIKK